MRSLALRFSWAGVPIEIQGSFFVLVGLIGLLTHLEPTSLLAWVGLATLGVLVHEAGHAVAFAAFGDRPSIVLHGSGGQTMGGHHGTRRMVIVSAAGPLAGLALGLLVLAVEWLRPGVMDRGILADALFVTIGLSLLNLVPLATFDGNAVLQGLIATATGRPPGSLGWMIGTFIMLALIGVLLVLGMFPAAIMLVVVAALQWRSLDGLFGRAVGHQSAAMLLREGRAAEAIVSADAELQRRPDDLMARYVRATALSSMSRFGDAISAFDAILADHPDHLPSLAGRSSARRSLGDGSGADADLAALLARPAATIDEALGQVIGLYYAHRYDEALELARARMAAVDTTPPQASHLDLLATVFKYALGDVDAALASTERLIARTPDDFAIHELRALCLVPLGRMEEARASVGRALSGAPQHPSVLETAGIIERIAGHPDRAHPLLLKAATARPDLPRARAELSACLTQLGLHDQAVGALRGLPAAALDDPWVRYARACGMAATGHADAASADLAVAARIRPCLAVIARVDPLLKGIAQPSPAVPSSPAPSWPATTRPVVVGS